MAKPDAPLIIGIDAGTQSIRAIAFDAEGREVAGARRETPVRLLDGGRGEYDPDALFSTVLDCLEEVAGRLGGRPVAGMAVASVGESCVPVDESGRALTPALVWFDRRTEEVAATLAERIGAERIFDITGLPADPTLSLCKLMWMKAHWADAFSRARRILCIADWIAFRLTGVAATDYTLASRTLALDIRRRAWSQEMLAAAQIDSALLPPLKPSGTALGPVRHDVLSRTRLAGNPVVAVGGHDHLMGSLAAGVMRPGMLLNSLGTAEAVLLATDGPLIEPEVIRRGYIQGAVATHRALCYLGGAINSSGGAVEWFRRLAGEAPHETLIEEARAAGPGSRGVVFLPHLAYSPPPEPDLSARGAFIGLTADTDRGAVYRAVLEGTAMQAGRLVASLAGIPGAGAPQEIRIIGGSSRNPLLLTIKAAVFDAPVTVVDQPEATTLGAALLGGIGAGLWPDLDAALAAIERREHVVEPDPEWAERYAALRERVFDPLQGALKPFNREIAGVMAEKE